MDPSPDQTVFVLPGEGTHSSDTDISLLRSSPSWTSVLKAISELGHEDAEGFITKHLGCHTAPNSLIVTVAINMLNADLWRHWGQTPTVVVGHAVGEIAAAYVAGMLSTADAINIAYSLGTAMAEIPGAMLHTEMARSQLSCFPIDGISVSAINYLVLPGSDVGADILSVTLCGSASSVDAYLTQDPASVKLKPEHPWHHPEANKRLNLNPSGKSQCRFISATLGKEIEELGQSHWETWLRTPVNFEMALAAVETKPTIVIETGAHPVLAAAVRARFGKDLVASVASMRRGENSMFVRSQRAALPSLKFRLGAVLKDFTIELPKRGSTSVQQSLDFAEQGLASQQLILLASQLSSFFPGLAAHDLYRFTSLEKLIHGWDHTANSTVQKAATDNSCLEVLRGYSRSSA